MRKIAVEQLLVMQKNTSQSTCDVTGDAESDFSSTNQTSAKYIEENLSSETKKSDDSKNHLSLYDIYNISSLPWRIIYVDLC